MRCLSASLTECNYSAANRLFESHTLNLLPIEDLLNLSPEALGAKIAATSSDLAVYSAAFVSAGFSR